MMTDSTAIGAPIATPSLELPLAEEEGPERSEVSAGSAEIDVVVVAEETTVICDTAVLDGGDVGISADVVFLNEDDSMTGHYGHISHAHYSVFRSRTTRNRNRQNL